MAYAKVESRLYRGKLLQGRYQIETLIGQGGMSYVYAANDLRLMGKQWAIKESIPFGKDTEHLLREARWLITLRHPNLPVIVDYFSSDEAGHAYMVMELIEGETLAERISRMDTDFSITEMIEIVKQLCDALQYLHNQHPPVIYRDLKPSNVMLNDKGMVKLIDFGIARQLRAGATTDTVKLGSIGYAAPEQYEGMQSDARSDLYAIGVLIGYMLTKGRWAGKSQFDKKLIRDSQAQPLAAIVLKLLSSVPDDRYSTALELREAVCSIVDKGNGAVSVETNGDINVELHPNQQRVAEEQLAGGAITIALLGTVHGIGTTHTALAIAHHIAKLSSSKIAYADLASEDTKTVRMLQSNIGSTASTERWHDLDTLYWNGVWHVDGGIMQRDSVVKSIAQLQRGFDLIVMDLGCGKEVYQLNEFMRATSSWVVGCAAPWRDAEGEEVLFKLDNLRFKRWNYVLPHRAPASNRQSGEHAVCEYVVGFPTCQDAFAHNEEVEQWVKRWIHPLLHTKKSYRLSRWIKSWIK